MGKAPYEEILQDVVCPSMLKNKLHQIWEVDKSSRFSVIKCIILANSYEADEIVCDICIIFLFSLGSPKRSSK